MTNLTKTYYCVVSSYDDKGNSTCAITDVIEAQQKPESTYHSTSRKDIYVDYFESKEEATKFIQENK